VTWRVGAYALATRAGRVLLIDPAYSRRAELPGGGVAVHETLLEGAARECLEETGYRFVAAGPAPLYVGEQFFCWRQTDPPDPGLRYWHTVAVVFAGTVEGDADPAWTPDPREVRRVRWADPAGLTPDTTRPDHWAALRRAGLV
jgi:8-oxo-dGTP pyrophosphatase MutT (NUDIX family)